VEEYSKRLRRYTAFALVPVRDPGTMLRRSEGAFRVVLDEGGERVSTVALAGRVRRWKLEGKKRVAFLIGGAEGHPPAVRSAADWTLSLSPLTLQHELALLVLLEQLYRVETMLAGHPYHR
jgi:23S rRNA (pseudouridine1915-N3)-methyltransferase